MQELYLYQKPDPKDILHYGVGHLDGGHSGRYPYGSGENPYQHAADFLTDVRKKRKDGFVWRDPETGELYSGDVAIAKSMGLTTSQFRTQISLANDENNAINIAKARKLADSGMGYTAIGRELGVSESTVRGWFDENHQARMKVAQSTADFLRKQVEEKGMIDIGANVAKELGISEEKLKEAIYILELEGYKVLGGRMPQATNSDQMTTLKVLAGPNAEKKDIYNYDNIKTITEYHSSDDGENFDVFKYPSSMDSKRLQVVYKEDGGDEKDGVMEIRPGVDDLSLGNSRYAQVRILVDGTHYLKGMAVYSDDLPEGIDVRFNTSKTSDVPALGAKDNTVLKLIKDDPDNPFGSLIKADGQSYYIDENGERKLSLINKRAEEGDWTSWKDSLPTQFLSKQSWKLANQQLELTKADKYAEFEEISNLTNPTVKKILLEKFAEGCDKDAVTLHTLGLPGQTYQVILPVNSLKDNEVYAPNFKDGTKLALVRFPHTSIHEIPICTVNNKNQEGTDMLGKNPIDAIGINAKVAYRLSGADFDGDTVMCIPTSSRVQISSAPQYAELKTFDPHTAYPKRDGMKLMTNTNMQMGIISNLITDMNLKGAKDEELIRAIKHSMVVIDAEKHKLDYKLSEKENGIDELKRKYQRHVDEDGTVRYGGASTLISKAKSPVSIPKRKGEPKIDKKTGELIFKEANETYIDKKTGKEKLRTQRVPAMSVTKDARYLSSGHPMEELYASYANDMKALANLARKEAVNTERLKYDPEAKKRYSEEVNSLNEKLKKAQLNAPREREAQRIAQVTIAQKKKMYPDLTKKELGKISQQAIVAARQKVGAKRYSIDITPKEWTAIQKGAISDNTLRQILTRADIDIVRQYATPKATTELSSARVSKIIAMHNSGYTNAQIAEAVGCSTSTVYKYL